MLRRFIPVFCCMKKLLVLRRNWADEANKANGDKLVETQKAFSSRSKLLYQTLISQDQC